MKMNDSSPEPHQMAAAADNSTVPCTIGASTVKNRPHWPHHLCPHSSSRWQTKQPNQLAHTGNLWPNPRSAISLRRGTTPTCNEELMGRAAARITIETSKTEPVQDISEESAAPSAKTSSIHLASRTLGKQSNALTMIDPPTLSQGTECRT